MTGTRPSDALSPCRVYGGSGCSGGQGNAGGPRPPRWRGWRPVPHMRLGAPVRRHAHRGRGRSGAASSWARRRLPSRRAGLAAGRAAGRGGAGEAHAGASARSGAGRGRGEDRRCGDDRVGVVARVSGPDEDELDPPAHDLGPCERHALIAGTTTARRGRRRRARGAIRGSRRRWTPSPTRAIPLRGEARRQEGTPLAGGRW